MSSFCPSCKLTFEDRDLAAGPDDARCPRCNGTLQPITRKAQPSLTDRIDRRRRITPTAPAGTVVEPISVPSFPDNLTPTQPRRSGPMLADAEIEEGLDRQEEPTMPGGLATEPPPPRVRFMQDEPTVPRAPIPPPRPEKMTPTAPSPSANTDPTRPRASLPTPPGTGDAAAGRLEPDISMPAPLPPPSTAMISDDPRAAPAGIVPPAALGGPQSADLVPPGMVGADGRRNTGLSDVFSPVGAFDPSSGEVIDTGSMDLPASDDDAEAPDGIGPRDPARGSRSPGERLLEFDEGSAVTGGNLELDLGHGGLDPTTTQPGVGISPDMSTGQVPKARPAMRPEVPLPSRPMPTHEMKAIARSGLPGWARLLVLLVVLGITGIVALELVSADEEIAAGSPEAAALDTLADVAAETARAERLLADIEQEHAEAQASQRKASARKGKAKAKHKVRKHGKAARSRTAADEDDDDEETPESPRAQALRHYKQGNEQLKQRAFGPAVQAFEAALRADPSFAYAHRGLGVAYASMKQPSKAIQQYRLYLKKAPQAPDAPQVRKILEQAGVK